MADDSSTFAETFSSSAKDTALACNLDKILWHHLMVGDFSLLVFLIEIP
jgi:hypothetical protein